MDSIKLLLVGDIHFPDVKSTLASADYKDSAFPATLAELSVPNRLGNVAREVLRLREKDPGIAGILLCGDLTSRGDINGYRDCVDYLNSVLQISDPAVWDDDQIHIVPGNHDVDRSLCGATSDIFAKFSPLIGAWKGTHTRPLTTQECRSTTLHLKHGSAVTVFSMNSCVGCGEKRSLPEKVREELADLLEKALRDDPAQGFDLVGEQMDTPAFLESDILKIVDAVQEMDRKHLPIVLAHHNILPQAIPRIDLYTEAINGGLVRSRLANCPRPVVYCHGHIHTDPIEVVQFGTGLGGPFVSLSVPQFVDGFDILEVHFGTKGYPLGCTVHRYRVQTDGGVICVQDKTARVPFNTVSFSQCVDDRMLTVLQHVRFGRHVRVPNLITPIRRKNKKLTEKMIAAYLTEAEWLGAIEIQNRDDDPRFWQVQKRRP